METSKCDLWTRLHEHHMTYTQLWQNVTSSNSTLLQVQCFFQTYYVYISLQSLFPKLSVLTKVRNIQLPTNGMINQSIDLDTLSHYDSLPKKVMPKLDQCNMIVREWQLWFFPNGRNHLWTCVIRMCGSDLCNCRFAWPKLDHKDPKATAH